MSDADTPLAPSTDVPTDFAASHSQDFAETLSGEAPGDLSEAPAEEYFSDEQATLGDRIAAARQQAGLTQLELANRLGVGAKVISAWENDRREPRANRLQMMAGMLNVSVVWLLTGVGDDVAPPSAEAAETAEGVGVARSPFHLAFAVQDIESTRHFYGEVLGCSLGRSAATWQDFDLFGHQLSAHVRAGAGPVEASGSVDGQDVPIPHFGVVLPWEQWLALVERIRAAEYGFVMEPTIRYVGAPAEQGTFFLCDPSGNALEFKAFRDPSQIFA
ncbi:MAG: helix-turn-helix domain-containing protein [Pseudomonadota bacterium]